MFALSCPACGGKVTFKSRASVFAVCPYCKSTVVRHDMNLEVYGTMADVQLDASPLQLGTRGLYEGKSFGLVGRLRVQWSDGFWNEWYVLFDDGRDAWLAEAQGFYAMNFPKAVPSDLPNPSNLYVGQTLSLQNVGTFQVDDIKKVSCVGSEGELPFKAPKGKQSLSIDLSGMSGQFAGLEHSDEGTRFYLGTYQDFEQFGFSFLREIDGW